MMMILETDLKSLSLQQDQEWQHLCIMIRQQDTDTQDYVGSSFHFAHIPRFQDDRLGSDICADDFMLTIMADETFDVQGFSPSFNNLVITPDFHDIAP